VVHCVGIINRDADGLSQNPCTSQQDGTKIRWYRETNVVLGKHALVFLCIMAMGVSITTFENENILGDLEPEGY
jgi:hypothetical protein